MEVEKLLKKWYGDATGPLGFRMPSEAAKALEAELKDTASDVRAAFKCQIDDIEVEGYMRKAVIPEQSDTVTKERADKSLIMTESIDRDREVVFADGCDFKSFMANPVVTFMHNYRDVPVGKALWVQRQKSDTPKRNGWMAKTVYYTRPPEYEDRDLPWLADAVWHLIQQGGMLGKSIGFAPKQIRPPSEKEIIARPELAQVPYVIAKCVVYEYAVGAIPVNPDALVQTVGKMRDGCKGGIGLKGIDHVLEQIGTLIPGGSTVAADQPEGDVDSATSPVTKTTEKTDDKVLRVRQKIGANEVNDHVIAAIKGHRRGSGRVYN